MTDKEKKPVENIEKESVPETKDKKISKQKVSVPLIAACVAVLGIFLNVFLFNIGITNGSKKLFDNYTNTYNDVSKETENKVKKYFYDKAEAASHVTNRVYINIGNIREISALEVMEATDIEYVVEKPDDNKHNYRRWAKFTGTAIYTVNLEESEIIADNYRNIVYIHIPKIEYRITDIVPETLLIHDGINIELDLTSLTSIGAKMEMKQQNQGEELIRAEFDNNPTYVSQAKKSAEKVITQLVESLNPSDKDIKVIIEFEE